MAIDTFSMYHPKMSLPVYTKVTDPRHNDYQIGNVYEMRIDDEARAKKRNIKGPHNWLHEALLIAKRDCKFGELEDVILAFDAKTKSREEAIERISPDIATWPDDKEVCLLIFLRVDKAKEFVTSEQDIIPMTFRKDDAEQDLETLENAQQKDAH